MKPPQTVFVALNTRRRRKLRAGIQGHSQEGKILFLVIAFTLALTLPSYRDYSLRGAVAEALNLSNEARAVVEKNAASPGTSLHRGWQMAPSQVAPLWICEERVSVGICEFGSESSPLTENVRSLSINGYSGMITIVFESDKTELRGHTLVLWPSQDGQGLVKGAAVTAGSPVVWTCFSRDKPLSNGATTIGTLRGKWAPQACR